MARQLDNLYVYYLLKAPSIHLLCFCLFLVNRANNPLAFVFFFLSLDWYSID